MLLNQIVAASGVAGFHFHQLRHTFACRWLEAGGSLEPLSVEMGQRTIPNDTAEHRMPLGARSRGASMRVRRTFRSRARSRRFKPR